MAFNFDDYPDADEKSAFDFDAYPDDKQQESNVSSIVPVTQILSTAAASVTQVTHRKQLVISEVASPL